MFTPQPYHDGNLLGFQVKRHLEALLDTKTHQPRGLSFAALTPIRPPRHCRRAPPPAVPACAQDGPGICGSEAGCKSSPAGGSASLTHAASSPGGPNTGGATSADTHGCAQLSHQSVTKSDHHQLASKPDQGAAGHARPDSNVRAVMTVIDAACVLLMAASVLCYFVWEDGTAGKCRALD